MSDPAAAVDAWVSATIQMSQMSCCSPCNGVVMDSPPRDDIAPGIAPMSDADMYSLQLQNNVSPVVPVVSDLTGCSRSHLLQSAISLCQDTSMDERSKCSMMTNLVGHLCQLLLLESRSPKSSPGQQSWATFSTGSSGPNHAAVGCSGAAAKVVALKQFQCPVCPHSKYLTEKGFYKHVVAWKSRAKSGGRRKKSTCPGLASHPRYRVGVHSGTEDTIVSDVLKLLTPGANAAHGHGTGNHVKVNSYFQSLFGP